MNPIIQKLDFNTYFDRQLESYIRFTKDELGKMPPDFDKLSTAKENFRDNVFNKLIKMINVQDLAIIKNVEFKDVFPELKDFNLDYLLPLFKQKEIYVVSKLSGK